MKVVVYGLFGGANFGDELFSKVVVEAAYDYGAETVWLFTSNERHSRRNVSKFCVVPSYPIPKQGFQRWIQAVTILRNADVVLFGGGGLFNEVFLRAGISEKGLVLATAKLFRVPYVIHGIEIGYVGSTINKWITGWCLRGADRLLCRSAKSFKTARIDFRATPILGTDLNHGWLNQRMSNREFKTSQETLEKKICVINLQHSLKTGDSYIDKLLETYVSDGYTLQFLVNSGGERLRVEQRFPQLPFEVREAVTVSETINILQGGAAFVTERFHFTMAALHANLPTSVIVSSSKVRDLVQQLVDKGVTVETARSGTANVREVLRLEGSRVQQAAVKQWALDCNWQLGETMEFARQCAAESNWTRRVLIGNLPVLVGLGMVLVGMYVLDRLRPLKRDLDLSKT